MQKALLHTSIQLSIINSLNEYVDFYIKNWLIFIKSSNYTVNTF